jgi:hypothetical protein
MKMKPFCPKCGRVFATQKVIEGRFCPKCDEFKAYEFFARPYGMCDTCRAVNKGHTRDKRLAYFRDYYQRVTKPKRKASRKMDKQATAIAERCNEIDDMFINNLASPEET